MKKNESGNAREDLFIPFYQHKKGRRDAKEFSELKIKEGSVQDLLKISMNTFTFGFLFTVIAVGIFLIFFFMFDRNIVMGIVFMGLCLVGFQMFLQIKKGEKENQFVNQ
ncbi:MAG: hypothetical protein PHI40_04330, partial [Caldisericia bacterium]|nr:hypothetical protein [Caldisericia bacterium]